MRLDKQNINEYSAQYDNRYIGTKDEIVEKEVKTWLQSNRFLDKDHFIKLGIWKSPRQKNNYLKNNDDYIIEITRFALLTKNEEARIKSLIQLGGVNWPVASVILHFAFPDEYPILDFRAIWSLGWEKPKSYTFEYWGKYCEKIRELSKSFNLPIRTIDKALWMYSKIHQKREGQ